MEEYTIKKPIKRIVTWHSPDLLLLAIWFFSEEGGNVFELKNKKYSDGLISEEICDKCGHEKEHVSCSIKYRCGYCSKKYRCHGGMRCEYSGHAKKDYFSFREHETILEEDERIIGF